MTERSSASQRAAGLRARWQLLSVLLFCAGAAVIYLGSGVTNPGDGARATSAAEDVRLSGGTSGSADDAQLSSASGSATEARVADDGGAAPGTIDPGSLPFDLGAVMEQVHFAFRPNEEIGEFSGGHATYAIELDVVGATLRPYHAPNAVEPIEVALAEPPTLRTEAAEVVEGAPLHLEVTSIERGARSLSRSGEPRVEQDGHLAIARGEEVVEHFRNRDEGVEQSWAFEQKPGGTGDLRVRVQPSGLEHVGATESGLHFADAATGLGFRYGHGTWIDAEGRETAVPAQYVDGEIELVVPSQVIEGSAYPAVLDPTISPEFGMDTPVTSPAGSYQETPRVASNGTDYLVVWGDARGAAYDIYGSRVSSAGVVLDPIGLAVSTAANNQQSPSVASNGTGYLVAWQDGRGATLDVYGSRVSSAGVVLDPSGIAVATAAANQYRPSVASNGTDYLVAWGDSVGTFHIYGSRVSSAGVVLDPSSLTLSIHPNGQLNPSAGSNGTDYLVAWQDYRDGGSLEIYGTRVSSAGAVLEPGGLALSTGANFQVNPSVGSNGIDYLVAWEDGRSGVTDIYGTRVSSAGLVLDPSGLALSTAAADQRRPSVASNGTAYLVAWDDPRSGGAAIYGSRVSSAGVVLDPTGLALSTGANPSVASNGTGYLLAWEDGRNGIPDIYGSRVSSAGVVLDPSGLALATAGNTQQTPSVASNGTNYLVAWQDTRAGAYDIYGCRVSSAGVVLDPSGLALSTAASSQQFPSVASNGTGYLVAWEDGRSGSPDIYGSRVSSAGVVLDPTGLALSTAIHYQMSPSVASNGTDYLVAWYDLRSATSFDVYGSRVSGAGVVLDPSGLALSTAASQQQFPSVASNGTGYLVAWQDARSGGSDIYGSRVSSAGVVLDPSGLALSTATGNQQSPSVASNGTDYLVVWHDLRSGATYDIYRSRVSSAGAVLDPTGLALSTATGNQLSPSVASDGTDYLVAWRDLRSATTYDVYGTRVQGGVVESPAGIAFAADLGTNEGVPRLASGPSGAFLLTYDRFMAAAPLSAPRARARLIQYGSALGDACGTNAECEGGFCADGVCCNTACAGGSLDCQACSVATGAATDGTCVLLTGNACVDSNDCTTADTCDAGLCVGGSTLVCAPATSCTDGAGSFTCSACPAGTSSVDGSGATACTPCAAGTFAASPGSVSCSPVTACTVGSTYQTTAPTATSDRVCSPVTACTLGVTYQTTAPTLTTNRVCSPVAACTLGVSYQTTAPTLTTNRVCSPVAAACSSSQYESTTPTLTTNRVCTALTTCTLGSTYQTTAPTATSDRVCSPVTACTLGVTYQTTAPTLTTNRVCSPVAAACSSSQYESTAPTLTTNRVCTALTVCSGTEYESMAASTTSDRECTVLSVCTATQYESMAAGTTSDRECTALTVCTASQYESMAAGTTSDRVCTALTVCTATQYESMAASSTGDRACTALTLCTESEYESAAATATTDRVCTACTVCDAGTFEVTACSDTADATCEAIGDGGVADGGVDDAGVDDAGVDDAGVDDAGVDDAGVDDAGVGDAGVDDAGVDDAGVDDAGVDDAGVDDAGARDASSPIDGSTGGDASIEPTPSAPGCGCVVIGAAPVTRGSQSSAAFAGIALLVLLTVRTARRRARR